ATITRAGVQQGDRIAISADNSVFWIASYLATLKLGAVAVPLPQRLGKEKVATMLTTVGAKIACVDSRSLEGYAALALPGFEVITPEEPGNAISPQVIIPAAGAKNPTCPVIDQDDLAALMFTSGTTGQPNAVKVSHRNIAANTESILDYLQLTPDDRMMVILPF